MSQRREYETDEIRVRWNSARCIHTGRCLKALPEVFDVRARPWVNLQGADADAVARAVERCPTGALLYERLDGSPGEEPRRPTVVLSIKNGPLLVAGDLDVRQADGTRITRETRLTLCRCGMSRNQPFCDNTHRKNGWESGTTDDPRTDPEPYGDQDIEGPTTITVLQDASLDVRGALDIHHSSGEMLAQTRRARLCRCGQSNNKPFCDSSHQRVGCVTNDTEISRERLEAETPAAFTPNPQVPDPEQAAE